MSLVTVTWEFPESAELTWLVALIVTFAELGRSAGAVYNPVESIVPTDALPPGAPFTLHVTV